MSLILCFCLFLVIILHFYKKLFYILAPWSNFFTNIKKTFIKRLITSVIGGIIICIDKLIFIYVMEQIILWFKHVKQKCAYR